MLLSFLAYTSDLAPIVDTNMQPVFHASDLVKAKRMIKAHRLQLLVRQLQRPVPARLDLHPHAQWPQHRVVLLLLPDLRKRLAVLHLQVVVLRQRAERLPRHHVLRHLLDRLLHEVAVLPPERRPKDPVLGRLAGEADAVDAVAPLGDRRVLGGVAVLGEDRRTVVFVCAVRIPVGFRGSSLLRVEGLDLGPQHVRVRDHPDQPTAFLQRACHVPQHAPRLSLGLERVVHAEHHRDDVEAAPAPSGATSAAGAHTPVDTHLPHQRDVSNPLAIPVRRVELALEHPRIPASAAAHLRVSAPRLLDRHLRRVDPHVQLDPLRRLRPLPEIAPLPTSDIQHQQPLAWFPPPGDEPLVRREFLYERALDPIVVVPQPFDAAACLAPVAASLRHGVVVLPHDIMDAARSRSRLRGGDLVCFALDLPVAEGFLFGGGDARGCARAFALARRGAWWRRGRSTSWRR